MSAPRPARPCTTPAIRSDSFTRSSCAPRTIVSPSAKHPSSADQRELVDRERHLLGFDDGPLERAVGDVEVADGLVAAISSLSLLEIAEDDAAHPAQDPKEARPCPVDADVGEQQPRARHEHPRRDQERSRAEVAGTVIRSSAISSVFPTVTRSPPGAYRNPGTQQHPLRVIAAEGRLGDRRRPVGGDRREQDARLDLRAGDVELVVDAVQMGAVTRSGV